MTSHEVKKNYTWTKDRHDPRDKVFSVAKGVAVPDKVDLREKMAPVPLEDQGQLGSCTAHAITSAMEYLRVQVPGKTHKDLSRLFLYWNERAAENTIREDAGARIRDGIKSVAKQGVCAENLWPYHVDQFKKRPVPTCYTDALKRRVLTYQRVPSTQALMQAVASGHPVVFGFTVFSSFESDVVASTGVAPFPDVRQEENLGGHAVMCCGYDRKMKVGEHTGAVICRNSWGADWGDHGYFYLPMDYVGNPTYADDFWTITNCLFQ